MSGDFRAKWGEDASAPEAWAARMVQGEILTLMSELRLRLGHDVAITLTARDPSHSDGSHDTIVTNDPTVDV